jgi:outer membrane lipoprotein SlyB
MNMPASNPPSNPNKPLWAAVVVLGVAVLAMGAALIRTQTPQAEPRIAVLPAASASSDATTVTASQTGSTTTPEDDPKVAMDANPPVPGVPTGKANSRSTNVLLAQSKNESKATKTATNEVFEATTGPRVVLPQNPEPAVARATAPARVVCANCGTVESVTAVEVEGTGSGAGAIAGGVLGAVVGNQVGGGDGKTLATILGAVGGGMAGNVVEKKMKKVTQFEVTVRMGDGSRRTLRQPTSPAVGSAVVVNGDNLQPAAR